MTQPPVPIPRTAAQNGPSRRSWLWVDPAWRGKLSAAGLGDVQAFMDTTQGVLLRALPDRENWRLELHNAHRQLRGAYLKKHHVRTWTSRLRALVGAGPGATAGRTEAHNATWLEECRIAAMPLIAYGERLLQDGTAESFVLTEELAGFAQLDHFLRARFDVRLGSGPSPRPMRKLLRQVAAVARRFHGLGFNHRDFYCCHFFIRESGGEFAVRLIDLQRVEHRRWRRRRWLIKDLAQLAYSAPRERVTCADRLAFVKEYLGAKKLGPADKRLVRAVLARQRRMERRLGLHP